MELFLCRLDDLTKISIDPDSDVLSTEPGFDFTFPGEVTSYTEAKLKTILSEIEACSDTSSQCSMSVADLTAAKERFNWLIYILLTNF